jgi:hypothetical protein
MVDTASGELVEAALFVRADLPRGARIAGPAVIVEDGNRRSCPAATLPASAPPTRS